MSWKNYFYFTRKEKTGLSVFFVILVLVFAFNYFTSRREAAGLSPRLVQHDSIGKEGKSVLDGTDASDETSNRWENNPGKRTYSQKERTYILFEFDPNTADSLTLSRLGLRSYVVRNLIKYRNKGGRFRKKDDLARIYGLNEADYKQLEPYIAIKDSPQGTPSKIQIATKEQPEPAYEDPKEVRRSVSVRQEKYLPGTLVDINRADTAEFKKIPQIGSVYARRMVKYRELLGGYCRKEQLLEVYGMDRALYESVLPWLSLENAEVERLSVNSLSLVRLKAHPYIDFYQAKAIVELRKKKRLTGIEDLSLLEEFSPDDMLRMEPYLSFE